MSVENLIKGEEIVDFFLVKKKSIKDAINGKYLDLILIDKTGDIDAKYWRCNLNEVENICRGSLIKIKAKVEEYKDKLQLNIKKIRLAKNTDNIKKENFIKKSLVDSKDMYKHILKIISQIKNEEIKKVVLTKIENIKEKLLYYPAAKSIHHNFSGGLLMHINSMLLIAESLIPLYPFLDKDLILAGIILHDLDKTEEMIADDIGVEEYSLKGIFLGHLVIGVSNIENICKKLNISEEIKIILEHLVLSHHSKSEFGSPVPPLLPEGELLHLIDLIDSKMNQLENIYKNTKPGFFSEKIFALDNRKFYKPTWK